MAKETKEELGQNESTCQMAGMDLNRSAITLKVSGLKAPNKVQRLIFGFFQKSKKVSHM